MRIKTTIFHKTFRFSLSTTSWKTNFRKKDLYSIHFKWIAHFYRKFCNSNLSYFNIFRAANIRFRSIQWIHYKRIFFCVVTLSHNGKDTWIEVLQWNVVGNAVLYSQINYFVSCEFSANDNSVSRLKIVFLVLFLVSSLFFCFKIQLRNATRK